MTDSRYFGRKLSADNSLNLIRLVLASSVLFAHTYFIVGRGQDQFHLGGQHIGVWAVAGFFTLSGYLITASRQRTRFADFLLLRIGRIFPAFLSVLLITACIFGPIAQLVNGNSLGDYLRTSPTPFTYMWVNLGLEVNTYAIGNTLSEVPYPNAWNGSLWTLYYEFLCYLFVGVLLIWKRARTNPVIVLIAWALSVAVYAKINGVLNFVDGNVSLGLFAQLLPYFLGGAVIRLFMTRVGLHWIPGVLALVVFVLGVEFGPIWTGQLLAPLLAYGLLWLSTVIPQPRWIATNDISYGVYVYAFPVQQLVAVFGLTWLNPWLFSLLSLFLTALFALASWYVVERPALRRVRVATGRSADRVAERAKTLSA